MSVGLHSVTVEPAGGGPEVDLSCVVETVDIHHGRDEPAGQPEASSATLDVVLLDEPLPPEVDVGALVRIRTQLAATNYWRFVGRITDIALGWEDRGEDTPDAGVGQIVCVGLLADYGRRVVGDTPWPQELDGARVAHVLAAAGLVLDPAYSDPGTVQILPRDVDSQPALDVAHDAADSASGVLWQTRASEIRYADAMHRRGARVELQLDACDVLVTPTWKRTTEGLVNEVSIGYGATPEGGEQPRYVDTRTDSVSRYGRYGVSATTALAALADAQALGQMLLVRNAMPVWVMAALPVDVKTLDDARTAALLSLDLHSLINLTGMPAVGGTPSAASLWVEGWRETLRWGSHDIELVVSGYCRTAPAPRWDDVSPSWLWGGEPWTEQRRNLAANPIGPVGTAPGWWIPSRATVAVSEDALRLTITDALASNHAQRLSGPFPSPGAGFATAPKVTPGHVYLISAEMRTNTAAALGGLNMQWYDAAGAALGGTVSSPPAGTALNASTYTRATLTGPAPAGAAYMYPAVGLWGSGVRNIGEWLDIRRVIIEDATYLRGYFDGDTADYPGGDYAWTGTPQSSPSTLTGRRELRRNLATNPSSEPGAAAWFSNNQATQAASDDLVVFRSGVQSRKSMPVGAGLGVDGGALVSLYNVGGRPHPVTPGLVYSHALYQRHNLPAGIHGRGRIGYAYLDAAGAIIGTTVYTAWADMPTPNVWQRFDQSLPAAPANAATFRIIANVYRATGSVTVATDAGWAEDCIVEQAAACGDYFDGSTPDVEGIDYAWTGAANASESVQREVAQVTGGLPSDLTWDGASCLGPPIDIGRWDDQPATLRWDQVAATATWNNYGGTANG